MADAIAHATLTFAETTSAVNGTGKGKANGQIDWSSRATTLCADRKRTRTGGAGDRAGPFAWRPVSVEPRRVARVFLPRR